MAFPETVLPVKVEVAINGSWTDITEYVYKEGIQIERGSADESTYSQPTRAELVLNNVDGRFSPRNPKGPYYGHLHRNQPILISVMTDPTYLDVPVGRAKTTDVAPTTGDFDLRVEMQENNWNHGNDVMVSQTLELAGQMQSGVGGWVFGLWRGYPSITYSNDWTAWPRVVATDYPTFPPSGRIALRVTVDTATEQVNFYQSSSIDGEWVKIGETVTASTAFAIPAHTGALMAGDGLGSAQFGPQFVGKFYALQLRVGIDGPLVADIDFTQQTVGDTSFADSVGNTWVTEESAHINNQWNRFKGEVVAWPTRWTTGGFDAWVNLRAETLTRRYLQGNRQELSTMARRIPSDPATVAYWPLEDGEDATQFSTPIPGGIPMTFNDKVTPATHVGPPGSKDLPSFDTDANWKGLVRTGSSDGWQVEFVVNFQQLTATDHQIMRVQTSGSIKYWRIAANNAGARVLAYNEDDVEVIDQGFGVVLTDWLNVWTRLRLVAAQNGSSVWWGLWIIPIGGTGGVLTFTEPSSTCGRVTAVTGPNGGLHEEFSGVSLGHIAVFETDFATGDVETFNSADLGFAGENAKQRLARLGEEAGTEMILVGNEGDTELMGAQRPDRLVDLLREGATADRGIFTDNRDVADYEAFKFIPRSALENQEPVLTLDYEGADGLVAPLDPTDDDLYLRNAITMGRERGSSYYVELATGPLSVAEVGEYEGGEDVNVYADEQLQDAAGWELHLGTWDEERYPTIRLLLQAAPHKIADWLKVEQGSVIRITSIRDEARRTWTSPGDLLLMVRGYREYLSQFGWEVETQCTPARPYDVTVLEVLGNRAQHVDTDGTVLAAAADADDTTLLLWTQNDQPRWTDGLEDHPISLTVGGEEVVTSGPVSVINDNAFTVSDVSGYVTSAVSIAWTQERVHPDPWAIASMKVTPDGVTASGNVRSSVTAAGTVLPGSQWRVGCWVYAPNGLAQFRTSVTWYDAAFTFISNASTSYEAIPERTWTWVERTVTAPANTSRAGARLFHDGTPAAADAYYVWGLRAVPDTANAIQDHFTRTSTGSWGQADTLQTWTNAGGAAADYDVVSTYGRHIHAATSTGHHSVIANPYSAGNSDLVVSIAVAALSTGASQLAGVLARYTDASNLYEARVEFTTANAVNLTIRKRVAGVETQLASRTSGITNVAGQYVRVRFQVEGSTLRAKIWLDGKLEPHDWHLVTTDTALTAAGSVGVKSVRNAGNTNASADFRFGEFSMINPQTMVVTRSANGVVKAQSLGESVTVTNPARAAI